MGYSVKFQLLSKTTHDLGIPPFDWLYHDLITNIWLQTDLNNSFKGRMC